MNEDKFEEELWEEILYYEYKDKLKLANKEIERLNKELTDTKNFKNSILEKLEKRTLERDKLRERLKVGKKVK